MTAQASQPTEDAEILTVREVASVLRVGVNKVYELVNTGDLPAFRIGDTWRIRRQHLTNWVVDQEKAS